jgi:hypothetical protein
MKFYNTRLFHRMLEEFKKGEIDPCKFISHMEEMETFFILLQNDYNESKSTDKVSLEDYIDEICVDDDLDNEYKKFLKEQEQNVSVEVTTTRVIKKI